jgi:hypothetical protein
MLTVRKQPADLLRLGPPALLTERQLDRNRLASIRLRHFVSRSRSASPALDAANVEAKRTHLQREIAIIRLSRRNV